KRCGSKNPGTTKICASCGNVMSETDKFELPAQQELIKDEAVVAKAERGPDITCKYCGARNAADAKNCVQCSADLTEGTARKSGEVLGAFSAEKKPDVKCPYCGAMNPATALKCSNCAGSLAQRPVDQVKAPPPAPVKANRLPLFIGLGVLVVAVILCGLLFFRTTDTSAAVQGVQWQRAIEIMEEQPVQHETWRDQVPSGAALGSCELKVRGTQDEPAPNSEKICGTPYTVDTGTGVGKVVQDCQYEVKDDWCAYTQLEWTVVDSVVLKGTDANPQWPAVNLQVDQREGDRAEAYVVFFSSDGKDYQMTVASASELAKYIVGSRWQLKVNALGGVVSAEPAQ
ncbi:MAG: zinc ribbon domain-containing protein, partial [Chloroflexi bacterium]|nr:zinc ribbon domain-containing protein [Chloroflexota bacterium]